MLRLRKLPVAKNSVDNKGGYQDFPSMFFCLKMPKSFAGEPLSAVFQKVSGSEKLYGKQRGYQDFPSQNFCLRVPKIFVGEHL